MKKRVLISAVVLTAVLSGCGVNKTQLDKASERLDKLTSSGLPDSLLIDAKSELFDAKQAKKDNQGGIAKECYKRAIVAMEHAEEVLAKSLSEKKPQMINKLTSLKESAKTELTGLHQTAMNTVLDSLSKLIEKEWILEAEKQSTIADSLLTSLKAQQVQANQIRSTVTGAWKFEKQYTSSVNFLVNAKEEKIFTFFADGKATFVEQKQGQSSHDLKEDYRYESYGTWDIKGDTIHVKTNRFAAVRQNFMERHVKDGKETWETQNKPAYDSTITDGSQDRFVAFTILKEDFKKQ